MVYASSTDHGLCKFKCRGMPVYLSECVSCSFFDALCEGGRRDGGRRSVSVVMILLSEGRFEGSHWIQLGRSGSVEGVRVGGCKSGSVEWECGTVKLAHTTGRTTPN